MGRFLVEKAVLKGLVLISGLRVILEKRKINRCFDFPVVLGGILANCELFLGRISYKTVN